MSQKNSEKPAAWIMVVHDHPAVREALASRIGLQPDQEGTELAWKMSNPIIGTWFALYVGSIRPPLGLIGVA